MKLIIELESSFNGGDDATFSVEAESKEAVVAEFDALDVPEGGADFYGFHIVDKQFITIQGKCFVTESVIKVFEVEEWLAHRIRLK